MQNALTALKLPRRYGNAACHAANLVDQNSFYVGDFRSTASGAIYANDRSKLVSALSKLVGVKQTATPQPMVPVPKAATAIGVGT